MLHTPSEVFHYTDSGGNGDAIYLSKSCTILQAAKKDLMGIIQLQVSGYSQKINTNWNTYFQDYIMLKNDGIEGSVCRTRKMSQIVWHAVCTVNVMAGWSRSVQLCVFMMFVDNNKIFWIFLLTPGSQSTWGQSDSPSCQSWFCGGSSGRPG